MSDYDVGIVTPVKARLSTPSDQETLPVYVAGSTPSFVKLGTPEAQLGYWRLLEVWSLDGRPFQLSLDWTGGGGGGQSALITVARATRVCIFARGMTIRAANLSTAGTNRVAFTTADLIAPVPTNNVFEVVAVEPPGGVPLSFTIPPYAVRCRIETSTVASLAATDVEVVDGSSNVISKFFANTQPSEGFFCGGQVATLRVTPPAGVRARITFHLAL